MPAPLCACRGLAFVVAVVCGMQTVLTSAAERKPNVVVIVGDDKYERCI